MSEPLSEDNDLKLTSEQRIVLWLSAKTGLTPYEIAKMPQDQFHALVAKIIASEEKK